MSDTLRLGLPLMASAQAQKHVTHNEALLRLDALVQLSVIARDVASPPASPAEGDRYLVAAGATGVWLGHSGEIAGFQNGAWIFAPPRTGWRLWLQAETKLLVFNGTMWTEAVSLQNIPQLGVNTTADSANRLSVSSSAVLLNHGGTDMRLKINKSAAADTATAVFQTGFSGRAEFGLAGDDNFRIKVSPDGASWTDAIVIDKTTGAVALPTTVVGDVNGPASSTNNALVRFAGTSGKTVQGATVLLNDDGSVRFPSVAALAQPPADTIHIAAVDYGGRQMLAGRSISGAAFPLQPLLARNKIGIWSPPGSVTTAPGVFGMATPNALGTVTARSITTASLFTRMRRLGYVSAATAGSFAGLYGNVAQVTVGDGAGVGGFHAVFRFGVSEAASVGGARMFVGLRSGTAAPTNTEPSTMTNVVGLAQISTSGNLQIVYGGSTAQAAIDLGVSFPAGTLSLDPYELALFAPSGSQSVSYRVERLSTGAVATGTLSGTAGTVLPAATTLLSVGVWRCNNATAAAVGLDIASIYVETDA